MVQGHVDTTATISQYDFLPNTQSVILSIIIDGIDASRVIRLIATKGYLALDGISLTVVHVDHSTRIVSFNVIPETLRITTLKFKRPGQRCNVEADPIAKMVSTYLDTATSVVQISKE